MKKPGEWIFRFGGVFSKQRNERKPVLKVRAMAVGRNHGEHGIAKDSPAGRQHVERRAELRRRAKKEPQKMLSQVRLRQEKAMTLGCRAIVRVSMAIGEPARFAMARNKTSGPNLIRLMGE
jgi:hypothetical protein